MLGLIIVGVRGFEPPASWSRTKRSNRAEPHPERLDYLKIFLKNKQTKNFYL